MKGPPIAHATFSELAAANVAAVDFRRPSRIGRDAVIALEATHDAFVRRLSTAWSGGSYAAIELEHVATDHLSIDDFVRSLPSPTALATLRIPALGAVAFVQVDLPFALLYVERLLGGVGDPASAPVARRPTDLESALIANEVLGPTTAAVDDALRDLGGEPATLVGFETAPQPMQLGSPGELLILLTYRVEVRGELPGQGLVTVAYPVAPLVGQLDHLVGGGASAEDGADDRAVAAMTDALGRTPVDVRVRIGDSTIPASQLARLAVGDVLSLDHALERPARLDCDDRPVGTAYLGRRGRRLAVQVLASPATHGASPTATLTALHPTSPEETR